MLISRARIWPIPTFFFMLQIKHSLQRDSDGKLTTLSLFSSLPSSCFKFKTRPHNSHKRVIWIFLNFRFSLSLVICLPAYNWYISWRERVCVCLYVCGSFRKICSSSKHSAVCLLAVQCKTFCWAYYFRHWVGSTFNNWQFRNILNYFNLKSI